MLFGSLWNMKSWSKQILILGFCRISPVWRVLLFLNIKDNIQNAFLYNQCLLFFVLLYSRVGISLPASSFRLVTQPLINDSLVIHWHILLLLMNTQPIYIQYKSLTHNLLLLGITFFFLRVCNLRPTTMLLNRAMCTHVKNLWAWHIGDNI